MNLTRQFLFDRRSFNHLKIPLFDNVFLNGIDVSKTNFSVLAHVELKLFTPFMGLTDSMQNLLFGDRF